MGVMPIGPLLAGMAVPMMMVLVLLSQGAGEEGVHAHAGAAAHGDHQVLQGEGQGGCSSPQGGRCTP